MMTPDLRPGTPVASPAAGPIADLTYRNYDGPLSPPVARWWAIARMSIRQSLKKRGFWVAAILSAYWYLVLMAVFYFVDTFGAAVARGQLNPIFKTIVWKDQFVNAFSLAQLLYFVIALFIATGTIANDNRANALLVYLSKPCSRLDYVVGKWLGIFIPITAVALAPMAFFWLYGALSFREYGFIADNPLLLPKLVLLAAVPGAIHASLALGISSLFNQGRVAGATYAGIYFIPYFLTVAMKAIHISTGWENRPVPEIVDRLYYASIDGMNIAMAKLVLGTSGSPLFPNFAAAAGPMGGGGGRRGPVPPGGVVIPSPPLELFLPIFLLLVAGGFFVAWSRVKAVEVVG